MSTASPQFANSYEERLFDEAIIEVELTLAPYPDNQKNTPRVLGKVRNNKRVRQCLRLFGMGVADFVRLARENARCL